ncbi:ulp1 protease family, C-terminal catalytic domain-containing protein [Tanacetum coccineum]
MNKEKDIEKVVDQDLDKPKDIEKESEFGNNEVEKNTEDLIKGADVCVEISKHEVSKGVLAIYEEPLKNLESQTSIFDKADFPSTGLEDIESSKGVGRNLFDEKSTVQNVNEEDMILQDSLLNLPFLSTHEVSCLEIDTQKSPQIQKQGIPISFHSNKLKLPKYVLPDGQAIVEKRQKDMLTETLIFHGKETKTFDSIKSKLVKKNDGMAQCMKEKSIDEVKGKSVDFKSGHPTAKKQQIKQAIEGDKNVPKTHAKKTDADKQDIKKTQVRKQTAAQLAKSKEIKAKTWYYFREKNGVGIECVFFLSLYPEIEVASTIIDLWTLVLNNEEQHRDKLSGDGNVYCHTVMLTQHSVEMGKDHEARRKIFDENIDIVLKQAKRKNFDDVNLVFFPAIKMSINSNHFYVICFNLKTSEIEIIDNIDNGIDDIKTRYGAFPYALMESFIDYLERKKYQNCYDLILAEPKQVEFSWKTTCNSYDYGVFVMRHMETYLGKGDFLQELKKEGPGQKVQLNMLRAKYMVKILLMSFNEKKKTLLKEAQAYIKIKPKSSKMLTGNDVRVNEELWKRFKEAVIKTIDN